MTPLRVVHFLRRLSQPPLAKDGNGVEVGAAELRLGLIPGGFMWVMLTQDMENG